MKRIFRILVLAVALVTGLTTVSAQTVQVLLIQKVPSLPSTVTNYLDDPFHYFNVQFVVNGAGSEGIDVYFDMDFTVSTSQFYVRTRPEILPTQPIHLNEGVNIMRTDVLHTQVQHRTETNVDYSNPVNALQLPEGTYQLCLDVYLWSDRLNPGRVPINVGPCSTFDICYSGSAPELVSPMTGAQMALNGAMVLMPSRKINFFWTPVISNCTSGTPRFKYKLKVVKVLNGQNYQDAIKFNPTVLSTEVRNQTYAVFDTLRDIKVQMVRGALYVAQVQAEKIQSGSSNEAYIIANDGNSQPLPFFWGYVGNHIGSGSGIENYYDFPGGNMGGTAMNSTVNSRRNYGYVVEDENEEGEVSEGIAGLTVWEGGVEELSELETIVDEMEEPHIVGFSTKRHYVESDGYYTIPMADDIEVVFAPARHNSFNNISYSIELYDYMEGGVDSIIAYEPLFHEDIVDVPEHYSKLDSRELVSRTLEGWGSELEQGSLYYLQLSAFFTAGYWKYTVADTSFYVNDMLAEHIRDTISRDFVEEKFVYPNGTYFQWGDDPDAPGCTTPQWKAPVDRTGDDIYDPVNHKLPTAVPEVKKAKTFPISWSPVKDVPKGDEVEYEVNVYELKPGQTLEEAVSTNQVLVSRTVTDGHEISETDTGFFKVFSAKKTYVMTLSTTVNSESNSYHFENGNEALPVVFKIVK